MEIQFWNEELFIDLFGVPVESKLTISRMIPPQIVEGSGLDAIVAAGSSIQTGSLAVTVGTVITNIITSGSLQLVWGMINTM